MESDPWDEKPRAGASPSSAKTPGKPPSILSRTKREAGTLDDFLGDRLDELTDLYERLDAGESPVVHVPTGLRRLDEAGLLERGVATLVLGHEGDGKSALVLQFLEGAAKAGLHAMGFFLEDPARYTTDRVFSPLIGESAFHLRRGKIDRPDEVPGRLRAARGGARAWTRNVHADFRRHTVDSLLGEVERNWKDDTALVVIDYAQAFNADENGMTAMIADMFWRVNKMAEERNAAAVITSQVKQKVKERGRKWFDGWKWRNPDKPPTNEAVEGYRPLAGDAEWAAAIGQRSRAAISHMRPGQWLRMHGANVKDDVAEEMIIKGNYGPAMVPVRLRWDGPTTRLSDPLGP